MEREGWSSRAARNRQANESLILRLYTHFEMSGLLHA